jgi:hypothetical protein
MIGSKRAQTRVGSLARVAVIAGAFAGTVTQLAAQTPSARPAAQGRVVLDESAYCRAYYQFGWDRVDAEVLKRSGVEFLGKNGMRRLEREVKKLLAHRKLDWSRLDWRDYAVKRYVTISHSMEGSPDRLRASATPPPKAEWFTPGFDDSGWGRFRKPFAVGHNAGMFFAQWSMASPGFQAAYLRFRFEVTAPRRTGDLTLSAEYIGGLRVFVNGSEIARGHLPRGEIGPETVSVGYGEGAYLRLFDELSAKEQSRAKSRLGGKAPPRYYGFADWRMPPGSRVYQARTRRLGPVKIPASLLRAGANLLAIEVRVAPLHPMVIYNHAWLSGYGRSSAWLHGVLVKLRLCATGPGVATGLQRPSGMRAWAEDMHRRVYSPDYLGPGESAGEIRLVAARNGTCSAQVVVATDRNLTGVKIASSDLAGPRGRTLPASTVRVQGMAGHPAMNLKELGGGRIPGSEGFYTGSHGAFPLMIAADRFGPRTPDRGARQEAWKQVRYFDHITARVPGDVRANTCQPYWLSFRIPTEAEPGEYAGAVTVGATGTEPVKIPVRLEVVDWRLPDPGLLQAIAAIEQSPYGVAKQYKVPLWSDDHFRLIETSLRQLGRIGNDWWFVPVVLGAEFGNRDDSMIRWVRRQDGLLVFDFRILDRYLELIVKHCGRPRVVSFVVMHGAPAAVEVKVLDAVSAKQQRLRLGGPGHDPQVRQTSWRAFATALYDHMKQLGLEDAMHWGYAWDTEGDPELKPLLRACVPDVPWTYGAHSRGGGSGGRMYGSSLAYYKSVVEIYGLAPGLTSRQGWQWPNPRLLNPRCLSSCHTTEGHSPPFNYRLLLDRALVAGYNGIGRIGGDYWAGAYYDGCRVSAYHMAGFSILKTLWPGPDGAEPSARFEAMLEGMQEAEARVFIEQAVDRKLLPQAVARRMTDVLNRHNRETLYIPVHASANLLTEGAMGWRERSARLYRAAAEVARIVGLDVEKTEFVPLQPPTREEVTAGGIAVPVPGERTITLKIRNWTGRPRRWKAAASASWIRPASTEGTVTGHQDLPVTLDGRTLEAGRTITGTVTITDVTGNAPRPVRISARLIKPMTVVARSMVYNVLSGSTVSEHFTVRNQTGTRQHWRMTFSVPWLKAEPASGQVPANRSATVRVIASPPGRGGALHKTQLELTAAGGKAKITMPLHVFVIPPYERPKAVPRGKQVPLHEAHRAILVSHRSMNWFRHTINRSAAFARSLSFWHSDKPVVIGKKRYEMALWVLPYHETLYKLEGSGFKAFSAEVGVNAIVARQAAGHENLRVCFEVHVDGRLVAHSGLMKSTDGARLLVVEDLGKAKELKLITRLHRMLYGDGSYLGEYAYSNWANPTLYR